MTPVQDHLIALQDKYNISGEEKDLGTLYLALLAHAREVISGQCRKVGIPCTDADEHAADVASHLVLRIRSGHRMRNPHLSVWYAAGNRLFSYPEKRYRTQAAATISLEEAHDL